MGTIDFEDLQGERVYSGTDGYNQSKLASVMFTYELARRLDGTGVTATVLHPGVVNTAFGAEDPSRIFKVIVPFVRPFMKTPEQGAATSIYLASSPAVEGSLAGTSRTDAQDDQREAHTMRRPQSACGGQAPSRRGVHRDNA
jgi:NAD(P)-dependent dehydrogenase (short-subunit alcohol dehydrogenase family)